MPIFGDAQTEKAFWRAHDKHMFPLRLAFLLVTLAIFPAFGLLDWYVGAESAVAMLCVRAAAFFGLLIATHQFAARGNTPDRREACIGISAVIAIGSELILVLISPNDAAQHYEFGLGVIMGLGAIILVPRFKTIAALFGTTIIVYLLTLPWHSGEMITVIVNTIFNLLVAGAVLIGSFERERLARLQTITSNELAKANAELNASRVEAVEARDAAISANRSKNHFLANMSHELRTPLNAILGFSDMIRSETFGPLNEPRYCDYIEHIHASGALLHTNINDLLDLARLDAGKFGWEDENFDLCTMIENAVATCEIGARDVGIGITCTVCKTGTTIHADESRIMQALINLITNAVKFSDNGGTVAVEAIVDSEGSCKISVRDTGCGMSAENLERVRTPFAQAHEDSYSKGKGGLGLGLAIVCGIVERMDGAFELKSEEDVGTVATLILPAERVLTSEMKAA